MNINYWVDYADQHDGELIHELDHVSGLNRYWLVLPADDNEKELISDSAGLNWYLSQHNKLT